MSTERRDLGNSRWGVQARSFLEANRGTGLEDDPGCLIHHPSSCAECGDVLTDDNLGCYVDDLCIEHISAGRCLDCRDIQREVAAARARSWERAW